MSQLLPVQIWSKIQYRTRRWGIYDIRNYCHANCSNNETGSKVHDARKIHGLDLLRVVGGMQEPAGFIIILNFFRNIFRLLQYFNDYLKYVV
jgi:hypothetical protein